MAPANRSRDRGDRDGSEGEDGEDLGQDLISPSPELLTDVTDFTRRAEHPARSAAKRRRIGAGSALRETGSAPAVTTAGLVLTPTLATSDPEVLRCLNEVRAALGRMEHEVSRLVTEVANLQRLGGGDDGD